MRISIEDKREEEPSMNTHNKIYGLKVGVEYLNANKTKIFPEPVLFEGGTKQDIAVRSLY